MPSFNYHRPETAVECVAVLDDLTRTGADVKVLAGGQSLLAVMALRLGPPSDIVDLSRVSGLDEISINGDGAVVIGAMVTHRSAEVSAAVAETAPMVAAALPLVGHRAIRSLGTVCGSLAHADPAAEMPAVALACGARFEALSASGSRTIDAADFFVGYLETALRPDELLVEVEFARVAPRTGVSVDELSRRHGDYAMVGLASSLTLGPDGTIAASALVVFGTGATPERVATAEESLLGRVPDSDSFAAAAEVLMASIDPTADNHASSAYRRHGAGVLVRRGLTNAASKIARSNA
ncbi:MAG: xanthine dehydrogenase family protein subunit M, partial [Actinobacteria bacterium]|nr:xanthine dehydrogenase family protein subunit M [Actinomycetota bacterium]